LTAPAVQLAFATSAVVCALIIWLRRHRSLPGIHWFFLGLLAMLWLLVSLGIELSGTTQSCQVFWAQFGWLGIVLLPTFWSFFLFEYTLSRNVPKPICLFSGVIVPALVWVAALTNDTHQLFYGEGTRILSGDGGLYVEYDHGPLFFVALGYLYLMIMGTSIIAARAAFKASPTVRSFFVKLFLTTVIPVVTNLLYVFNDVTLFDTDPTPFSFAFSLAVMFWLIADNRWVDINSIARELLFYNSSDPVFIIDLQGQLYEANPQGESLLSQQAASRDDLFQIPELGRVFRALVDTQALPDELEVEFGERRFVVRHYPIALGPGRNTLGWAVAFVDVTIQKLAAERALAADRIKSQFVATVSHELRTPLTVINGSLMMLANKACSLPPDQVDRLISLATKSGGTLATLVDDLLEVQRLESADLHIERDTCDLAQVLEESVSSMENYQTHKEIELCYTAQTGETLVCGDHKRLRQVIVNILSNAIKFSPARSKVDVRLFSHSGAALIEVKDSGRGIPPNSEDKVFGRFSQVDASDAKEVNGSGLGMHISRQILFRHNGGIKYESDLGVGTTFTVELPLQAPKARSAVS
jgi:signal transduction histidine kinase